MGDNVDLRYSRTVSEEEIAAATGKPDRDEGAVGREKRGKTVGKMYDVTYGG